MTDDATPIPSTEGQADDGDDVGGRLRTGFDELAREAGAAPAFDDVAASTPPATTRRWSDHRGLAVAAAVLAVIAVAAGVFALTRGEDDQLRSADHTSTTATTNGRPLFGTHWWLVGAKDHDTSLPVPATGTQWFGIQFRDRDETCPPDDETGDPCVPGPQVVGSDACNGVSRRITVRSDRIDLGEGFGAHTDMLCTPALPTLVQGVWSADRLDYEIDGDELRLTTPDGAGELLYQAIDGPFGPTTSKILDEGEAGGVPYRLVWEEGDGLTFQQAATADPDTFGQPGFTGVGRDPGRVNAMLNTPYGDKPYLLGLVPADAARIVYRPEGGKPQEVAIHDLDRDDVAAIGEFVEGGQPKRWTVTAYDADGAEIHTLTWG